MGGTYLSLNVGMSLKPYHFLLDILTDLVCLHLPGPEAVAAGAPADQPHAVHGPGVRVSAHLSNIDTFLASLILNSES